MGIRPFFVGVALAGTVIVPQPLSRAAREQTADQQVRHVLNRLAFGARPGDYEKVRTMGVDAWIAQQLSPERIPDPAVARLIAQLPTYSMSPEKLIEEFPRPNNQQQAERARLLADAKTQADSQRVRRQLAGDMGGGQPPRAILPDLQALRVGRAAVSEHQLEEVLVDFWLNHFSVFAGKNQQIRYYLADYERNVIRPRVFGKFRDLVEAVAKSPAMLIYLDNQQSIADTSRVTLATYGGQPDPQRRRAIMGRGVVMGAPPSQQVPRRASGLNENYGRELLELHTLGVDGGYTQQDVTEVARALTGWTIVPPQDQAARAAARSNAVIEGRFMFRPQTHDAEPKTVLGVKLKGGRGIEDGEQVLDILCSHPSTAKYIAKKLAIRFISDKPPQSIIDRAATTFTKTGGDLREVVRVIVTSDEFFSSAAYRAKVKSPFEVVVSALRLVNAPADPSPQTHRFVAELGQAVFNHQTPDGWPETGDEWINTGSILNRINFGLQLASGRVPGANQAFWPLPAGIRNQSKEAQVDAVVAAFLGGEASAETRAILISGNNPMLKTAVDTAESMMRQPPDTAGVTGLDAAAMRRARGGRAFGPLPPLEGVPLIVGLALGSPEFQRR